MARAAATTIGYLWGMSKVRDAASRRRIWIGLAVAVMVIWGIASIASVALPVVETGSDPTRLPIWALAAPIGAALVTALASVVARIFSQAPE